MRALRRRGRGRGLSTEEQAEKTKDNVVEEPVEENDVRREEPTSVYAQIFPVRAIDLAGAKEDKNETIEDVEEGEEENGCVEDEDVEDWFDEDAEDEEYVPSESGDSDDEELVTSEVYEEAPTVGSLFACASGLRLRRTSPGEKADDGKDDNGDFTEQDGELWASVDEKQQWIAHFEAASRAYFARHGHRVDSTAIPDARAQVQHELKLERRYRNVLLALAVIYLIRLLSDFTGGVLWSKSKPTNVGNRPTTEIFEASPRVVVTHKERDATVPISAYLHDHPGAIATTERLQQVSSDETHPRMIDEEHAPTLHIGLATPSSIKSMTLIETPQTVAAGGHAHENSQRFVSLPDQGATVSQADALVSNENGEVGAESSSIGVPGDRTSSVVVDSATDQINQSATPDNKWVDERRVHQEEVDVQYELCRELFYKLIKTRANKDLKAAAIEACSKAVDASEESAESMLQVRAYLLRGDLWSLLYEAEQAELDYDLAAQHIDPMSALTCAVEAKIMSNRWIDLYRKKQYKRLQQACQGIMESKEKGASKTLHELASEWLRAFRRETNVLDALTKSRSWTIYRPERDL